MKISCQSCGAKYNIADEKVRGKIVKIACKKCGARIEIDGREGGADAAALGGQEATATSDGNGLLWTVSVDDNDQRELTTDQLADLFHAGSVNAETYVWRDGLADWQMIQEIDDLRFLVSASALTAIAGDAPRAAAAPAAAAHVAAPLDTAGARLGGTRRGGAVDLFANAAGPSSDEEDVATSAPSAAAAASAAAIAGSSTKPIGARNENSVLFSLAALTASGPANSAPAIGDDEKSGLIDIQKLAAAAKGGGAKDDRARLDDIMNLGGGGAFGASLGAPILAPPPEAAFAPTDFDASPGAGANNKKKSPALLIGGIVGVIALIAIILVVVLTGKTGGDETASAKGDKKSSSAKGDKSTDDDDSKGKSASDDDKPKSGDSDSAKAVPAPTASDSSAGATATAKVPGAAGVTGAGTPTSGSGAGGSGVTAGNGGSGTNGTTGAVHPTDPTPTPPSPGGGGKPCRTLSDCMGGASSPPPPAPTPTAPAATGGGGTIDKESAVAALKGIGYKDCGSGGGGKIYVTFGPNGNVTSASVSAGTYDASTKSCVQRRFMGAHVPAYGGAPKTFGWSISL